jgi:RNA polymerase sigma-70 factor (ECF subfamily)
MADDDPRTDGQLVEAANRGDDSAFEALYFRYRDWVVRLALRYTASQADALDVLQETFTYLLGKLPDLRLTARMTTFLFPVVKHLSLALLQKKRRHVAGEELLAVRPAPEPDRTEAARAELAAVCSALPQHQLEVLLLRFVDSMSLQEIADALGIPLGTVKSRLHHAIRALREDEQVRRYFKGDEGG